MASFDNIGVQNEPLFGENKSTSKCCFRSTKLTLNASICYHLTCKLNYTKQLKRKPVFDTDKTNEMVDRFPHILYPKRKRIKPAGTYYGFGSHFVYR